MLFWMFTSYTDHNSVNSFDAAMKRRNEQSSFPNPHSLFSQQHGIHFQMLAQVEEMTIYYLQAIDKHWIFILPCGIHTYYWVHPPITIQRIKLLPQGTLIHFFTNLILSLVFHLPSCLNLTCIYLEGGPGCLAI